MQEKPDAADLLATAREVVLNELLPALPPEKALAARMVAAAMALALRQADAPALMDKPDLATLAADIRAGRHDPGTENHARVMDFLHDYARARAAVSAPKALG